jgi:serine/threonine protein kinase
MNRNEITELETLFHALVEIPAGAERDAAARRLSGGDDNLARRALALAISDERAVAANQAALQCSRPAASAVHTYGNYRTVRPLGSGGMGAVYLAERADGQFHRTVAIKVIAPHVAGEAFRERFLAERQILAALSHPNITRFLDGGVTDDGTPYLVIEYVDGQPLDVYCDANKLALRQRLELFRKVCEPVAYAHRNLVVHRDLKPSNILVTKEGQPMLLDFGTAKLLAGTGTDASTAMPLMTLRYSSPEQRGRARITTGTDIYSLGVILYELLTGAWPFGDPSSPHQILERLARDTPMTSPQTVITEEASLTRSSNPRSLRSSLAGDLSSILSKALDPAAERRYDSVTALSADVENWLAGRPVAAKPPSLVYGARKFVRRHWIPVVAAAVFAFSLTAATLYASRQASVARAEALRASTEARKAERVNQFLNDMLSSAGNANFDPHTFTVAEMLEGAERRLAGAWKDDPLTEATLRSSLGASYSMMQSPERARVQLETARAIFQKLGDRGEEAKALYLMAGNEGEAGLIIDSISHYREALALLNRLGKEADPLLVFRCKWAFGDVLSADMNQTAEAERLFAEAIALAEPLPSIPRAELASAKTSQGAMWLNQGEVSEAEAVFLQAIEIFRKEASEGPPSAQPFYYLAILKNRAGDVSAAKEFGRLYYETTLKNLGPDHFRTAIAKLMWTRYRAETGESKEAVPIALEAIQICRKNLGPLSSTLWTPLTNFSRIMNLAGRFADAERSARQEVAIIDNQQLPEADTRRAGSLFELGTALRGQNKVREGNAVLDRAARIYEQSGPLWAKRAERARQIIGGPKPGRE